MLSSDNFQENGSADVLKTLEVISKESLTYAKKSVPHHFDVSISNDKIIYIGIVLTDLLWLDVRWKLKAPILHVINYDTHFQIAIFLNCQSWRDVWNAFMGCWSSVYVGYPRIIKQTKALFFVEKWKEWTFMAEIPLKISGIESHSLAGLIERYHNRLWKIFQLNNGRTSEARTRNCIEICNNGNEWQYGIGGVVTLTSWFWCTPDSPSISDRMAITNRKDGGIGNCTR